MGIIFSPPDITIFTVANIELSGQLIGRPHTTLELRKNLYKSIESIERMCTSKNQIAASDRNAIHLSN